jgi:hypothetical protein
MAKPKTSPAPKIHHYVRTPLAALLGALAMLLVSMSILLVWANRTLTDTNTYVNTVGPVIEKPELQDFVATKLADQALQSASVDDLAGKLLTPQDTAGKTPEQVREQVAKVMHDSVTEALKSPQVVDAWKTTNRSVHAELVGQLDANAPAITLDLTPLLQAVTDQLKQTKMAPVADKIDLKPGSAQVQLKGKPLENVHNAYKKLKTVPYLVVLLALALAGLAVWTSAHHAKTLRRMLVGTGVSALLVAAVIALPRVVQLPSADPAASRLAMALAGTLLHGLQEGCLVLGVVCILAALGSKLYERR